MIMEKKRIIRTKVERPFNKTLNTEELYKLATDGHTRSATIINERDKI
jgi:hypothetical protein